VRRLPGRPHVQEEDAEEDDRVHERQGSLERDDERVERRDREIRHLDRLVPRQQDLALPETQPHREDRRRPADPEQEPVAARHVGGRERRVRRVGTGAPREVHVHGVFGQHRNERQRRERERARDVELRHLARPREDEGGAEDADAGHERRPVMRGHEPAVVRNEPRQRQQEHHTDPDPLSPVHPVRIADRVRLPKQFAPTVFVVISRA
jgi:hypothetical protein